MDVAVAAVERHPEAYPIVHEGIRRALLRKFPYGIFYDYVAFTPEKLEIVEGHLIEGPSSTEQRRKLLALLLKNLGLVEAVRLVPEEKWREALRRAYSSPHR